MIVSGIVLAVIGYMSGLTVLKAIGGILIVVMWGSSRVFWPAATAGLEVAGGADSDAQRPVACTPGPPRLSPRLRHLRRATRSGATSAPARQSRRAKAALSR